jgi:hypothetical protein
VQYWTIWKEYLKVRKIEGVAIRNANSGRRSHVIDFEGGSQNLGKRVAARCRRSIWDQATLR